MSFLSRFRHTPVAALALLAGVVQAGSPFELSHRNLFALCAPMNLVVEPMPADPSRSLGLTAAAIEHEIEPRLRDAHLFEADSSQYLSIHVNLSATGDFYSLALHLKRYVSDMGYGIGGFVTMWSTDKVGVHGGDRRVILKTVAMLAEEFLNYYLQVNEEECRAP